MKNKLRLCYHKNNLCLTSVSASEVVIGDVADEFMPPCQRVHAVTVTVYMAVGIRTGVAGDTGSQANRLDHSATTHRLVSMRTCCCFVIVVLDN